MQGPFRDTPLFADPLASIASPIMIPMPGTETTIGAGINSTTLLGKSLEEFLRTGVRALLHRVSRRWLPGMPHLTAGPIAEAMEGVKMEVSPEAQRFGDIYPIEETEEYQKRFRELVEEEKIVKRRLDVPDEFSTATVVGASQALQKLQDDLRKAGYKKLR